MITAIIRFLVGLFSRRPGAVAEVPAQPAASSRFNACLAEVLRHEGGYVDHPADPGGATNLGITHTTLAAHRGRPVTKDDVRALTRAEAAAIYHARYWIPIRGDALPPGLDLALFDFAVNSGPARAVKALQGVLHVTQDGVVGPVTLAAIAKAPGPATLAIDLCDARMRFLRSLPTWATFGRGWTKRVSDVEVAALEAAS